MEKLIRHSIQPVPMTHGSSKNRRGKRLPPKSSTFFMHSADVSLRTALQSTTKQHYSVLTSEEDRDYILHRFLNNSFFAKESLNCDNSTLADDTELFYVDCEQVEIDHYFYQDETHSEIEAEIEEITRHWNDDKVYVLPSFNDPSPFLEFDNAATAVDSKILFKLDDIEVTPFNLKIPNLESDIPCDIDENTMPISAPPTPVPYETYEPVNIYHHLSISKMMTEFELKPRIADVHETLNTVVVCVWKTENFGIMFVFNASTDSRLCFAAHPERFEIGKFYYFDLGVLFDEEMPHSLFQYFPHKLLDDPNMHYEPLNFENGDIVMYNADLVFDNSPAVSTDDGCFVYDSRFGYVFFPLQCENKLNDSNATCSLKFEVFVSDKIASYWSAV